MNYSVFKLRFTVPVHFGGDSARALEQAKPFFTADTLFSALCHTALLTGGDSAVEALCAAAAEGALLLSDGMPWRETQDREGDVLYLPRLFLTPTQRREVAATDRKKIKKVKYLPASSYQDYLRSMAGGPYLDISDISQRFGVQTELTKAAVPDGADARPYFVGLFTFDPDCGVYFILGWEDTKLLEQITKLLTPFGYSGMGGKISSGYGKFDVADSFDLDVPFDACTEWLIHALNTADAPWQLTLSSCLPTQEELAGAMEGASYQLARRSGFITDPCGGTQPYKKRTQYVFQAGSVFRTRFQGELSTVGESRGHPVYRYNRPLWLGVSL